MPLFTTKQINTPISVETAWKRVMSTGENRPNDGLLLPPYGFLEEEKIIWLEKLRQVALGHGGDLSLLKQYKDFQEYALERRPDPTRGEWLWLYSQIGERHRNLSFLDVVEIMLNRDAFLPFLVSVPDMLFWNEFLGLGLESLPSTESSALSYQSLESAIQEDAPGKVTITKMMCRKITDSEIMTRAFKCEKSAVVASLLQNKSLDRIVEFLIKAHNEWKNPTHLFDRMLPQREDEIAAWRDPWGNGFFWYLYRRPVLSLDVIRGLPQKVLATFETENRYGLSPKDLWPDYCPVVD